MALALDNTPFCSRPIKVCKKYNDTTSKTTAYSASSTWHQYRGAPGRPRFHGRYLGPNVYHKPTFTTKNKTWVNPGIAQQTASTS